MANSLRRMGISDKLPKWIELIAMEDPDRPVSHVAERIGISPSYAARVLKGRRAANLRVKTLDMMADHLGLPTWKLVWFVDHLQAPPPFGLGH